MADEKTWKELWNENYRGEGDCAGLEKFVKTLNYGARQNVSYLPWATVRRIFQLQDGVTEVLQNEGSDSIVDIDRVVLYTTVDENGATEDVWAISYFINVKATWHGREYIEHYPIQDNNGKPLTNWTQNELNKVTQRGTVKAIAMVSGIGYKLFEDGDLQFDGGENKNGGEKEPDPEKKSEDLKNKNGKGKKAGGKKDTPNDDLFKGENPPESGPTTTPPDNPAPDVKENAESESEPEKKPEASPDTNRFDMENQLKHDYIGDNSKREIIKTFLKDNGVTRFQDLSDDKLKELFERTHQ